MKARAALLILTVLFFCSLSAQTVIHWQNPHTRSRTTISLQVVGNPPLRPGSPIHDAAWNALEMLGSRDTRLALWYPYPHMGIAELSPPTAEKTFWDFTVMDPIVTGFFHATAGRPVVLSFATVPQWMYVGSQPGIPANVDSAVWNYEQGSQLRDVSLHEITDYYERVARWYIRGGFYDEHNHWHGSGHFFHPAYWEVGNEPEYEHAPTPQQYTQMYDAIVARLHHVDPHLKFTGMSLAIPDKGDAFLRYFLNHKNHTPGTPLDAISYHFYALGKAGITQEQQAASFFAQADGFLNTVAGIERVRRQLSPATETQINETGCIAASDQGDGPQKMSGLDIPGSYWNLCGAMFAYLASQLSGQGIQVVGASQLLGYPTQYPSVTLLDWTTGRPNARYRALQLVIQTLSPGDKVSQPLINSAQLYAQAICKRSNHRFLLLVNKTAADQSVRLDTIPQQLTSVDISTGSDEAQKRPGVSRDITLHGYSITVAQLR